MHLGHRIPWNLIASHLVFVKEHPGFGRRTDLFPLGRPNEANDFNHFARVLVATIREFSITERAKYPSADAQPKSGNLFNDALIEEMENKYGLHDHTFYTELSSPLSPKHQDIDYWVERAGRGGNDGRYCTGDGDLADAVKMLITLNQMPALLRLANHPYVPLHNLDRLSWGHGFGVHLVAENALWAYLLLNISATVKFNAQKGSASAGLTLLNMESFQTFAENALPMWDYPAQNILHREFWLQRGVKSLQTAGGFDPLKTEFAALQELRDYMKVCFEIVFRYDVVMRESGVELDWMQNIVFLLCRIRRYGRKHPSWTSVKIGEKFEYSFC